MKQQVSSVPNDCYKETGSLPAVAKTISECGSARMTSTRTKEYNAIVAPERHDDPSALVDREGLHVSKSSGFPNAELPIVHLTETGSRDAIMFSHPDHSRALDAAIAFRGTDRISTGAGIKQTSFHVSASSGENCAGHVERKGLDGVAVAVQGGARKVP